MFNKHFPRSKMKRLTVTWDVFKSVNSALAQVKGSGLTVTWDVFKLISSI